MTELILALGAGLLSFLSPCVLPLIPGYISYVSGKSLNELLEEKKVNKDFLVHLESLLLSKEIRRKLTTGICKLAKPDATKEVVQEINKILENA